MRIVLHRVLEVIQVVGECFGRLQDLAHVGRMFCRRGCCRALVTCHQDQDHATAERSHTLVCLPGHDNADIAGIVPVE